MVHCTATTTTNTTLQHSPKCSGFTLLNPQVPRKFVPLDRDHLLWGQPFDNLDHLLMPPPPPRTRRTVLQANKKPLVPCSWTKRSSGSRTGMKPRVRSPVPPHTLSNSRPILVKPLKQRGLTIIESRKPLSHCSSTFSSSMIPALLSPENTTTTASSLAPKIQLFHGNSPKRDSELQPEATSATNSVHMDVVIKVPSPMKGIGRLNGRTGDASKHREAFQRPCLATDVLNKTVDSAATMGCKSLTAECKANDMDIAQLAATGSPKAG